MAAQANDKLYSERVGIPGVITVGNIKDYVAGSLGILFYNYSEWITGSPSDINIIKLWEFNVVIEIVSGTEYLLPLLNTVVGTNSQYTIKNKTGDDLTIQVQGSDKIYHNEILDEITIGFGDSLQFYVDSSYFNTI